MTVPSRACGLRRCLILLVRAAGDDPQRIVRQWPLQRLRLVPWRAHPDVALFLGREDHRHRLRVDWLDDRVRRRRQEAVDEMRAGDRLRLRATVAVELKCSVRQVNMTMRSA
jgi:hypothetical protein